MRSVELFTGAGGLALGSQLAGFHHVAVVERDHDSCKTLCLNQQYGLIDWPIFQSDVAEFDYATVTHPVDLVAGGPPCQPFSLGGKHEGQHDRRNLFPEAVRAVQELHPHAFVFENVKGLLRNTFAPYYRYTMQRLGLPFLTPYPDEPWEAHRSRLDQAEADWSPKYRYTVSFRLCDAAD
ncbi:MAG: DNA cytosine methyltransferase, partial [Actinobacteria bacterium]|nr:DNA cytosine methyltransferase [Actinomycetota bacterium]